MCVCVCLCVDVIGSMKLTVLNLVKFDEGKACRVASYMLLFYPSFIYSLTQMAHQWTLWAIGTVTHLHLFLLSLVVIHHHHPLHRQMNIHKSVALHMALIAAMVVKVVDPVEEVTVDQVNITIDLHLMGLTKVEKSSNQTCYCFSSYQLKLELNSIELL